MDKKRIVFMGTPDFAVPVLNMLINNTTVVLVVTQPDKIVGRKQELQFSPVKKTALLNNIPVFQPLRIKKDYNLIATLKPDLIVTCAYGQIIPKGLLDIPKYGAINVHASLLPSYRGAAPIQWALLNGEKKTGVSLMYMDEGMDTGDIITKAEINISASDNVGTLHDKLSTIGASLLQKNLDLIFKNEAPREKQDHTIATYAPMIQREDEHLDFSENGLKIINRIRALSPWPLANFKLDGLEVKVIKASFSSKSDTSPGLISVVDKKNLAIECLDGLIYLEVIKPFGKKEMPIASFLNGNKSQDLKGKMVE